jgi:membrane protease YdiL (CAAX protease family)
VIADAQSLEPGSAVAAEAGAVLVATSIALVPITILLVRRIFPGRTVIFARWGFSHVVVVALVGLAGGLIAGMLLGVAHAETRFVPTLLASVALFGSASAAVAWFAHRLDPAGLRCLGLWPGKNLRAIAAGITAYVLCWPGLLGLGLFWPWFLTWTGAGFELPFVDKGMAGLSAAERPIAIAIAVVVMPLLEETLFRVFLQPLLVQNLSDKLGILATSLLFAGLHGTSAFLPILGLSLLLGSVMLRTQRLAAVWAIHALHNGLMLLQLYALPSSPAGGHTGVLGSGLFFS